MYISNVLTLFICTFKLEKCWGTPRRGPTTGTGETSAFIRLTEDSKEGDHEESEDKI